MLNYQRVTGGIFQPCLMTGAGNATSDHHDFDHEFWDFQMFPFNPGPVKIPNLEKCISGNHWRFRTMVLTGSHLFSSNRISKSSSPITKISIPSKSLHPTPLPFRTSVLHLRQSGGKAPLLGLLHHPVNPLAHLNLALEGPGGTPVVAMWPKSPGGWCQKMSKAM